LAFVLGWGKVHLFVLFAFRDRFCILVTTAPYVWGLKSRRAFDRGESGGRPRFPLEWDGASVGLEDIHIHFVLRVSPVKGK
jgi:hypothetical protein